MSIFIIETILDLLTGELHNIFEPNNPFSASKPTSKILRFNNCLLACNLCASSNKPAVPDALSFAPLWIATVSGFNDLVCGPPYLCDQNEHQSQYTHLCVYDYD